MTKKNYLVKSLTDSGSDIYWRQHLCYVADTEAFPTYEEAVASASKRAGKNIDTSYGIYEMVAVVEAPAPDVNVTKI